jgi:hypothetical protein
MLQKGKGLFYRVRDSDVRATCQHLHTSPKRPIQNREAQILLRIKRVLCLWLRKTLSH